MTEATLLSQMKSIAGHEFADKIFASFVLLSLTKEAGPTFN